MHGSPLTVYCRDKVSSTIFCSKISHQNPSKMEQRSTRHSLLPGVVRLHPQGLPDTGDVLLQCRAGCYRQGCTAAGLEITGTFH